MPDTQDRTYWKSDLTGTDFSTIDLTDHNLAHSIITGCVFRQCRGANFVWTKGQADFNGADITGCKFEKADLDVLQSLVGATWNGVLITHVSDWVFKENFWAFCTNAFVSCGCMIKTLADWQRIGENMDTMTELLQDEPELKLYDAYVWWQLSRESIETAVANLTATQGG